MITGEVAVAFEAKNGVVASKEVFVEVAHVVMVDRNQGKRM